MIATSEEMRKMDQRAVEEYQIPMHQLMKQAADAFFEALIDHYGRQACYGIFCGSGNNGGDGYALALRMKKEGVSFYLCALQPPHSESARYYAAMLTEIGDECMFDETRYMHVLDRSDILIDAIFGTGLNRPPQGNDAQVIQALNHSRKPIVSMDVPSGISEQVFDPERSIHAQLTITFECVKKSLLPYSRRSCCGKIKAVSIGMPKPLRQCEDQTIILDPRQAGAYLPLRKAQSHKGTYGRVLVIGGSKSMSGALVMCTSALLRSGAGLVTCMLPSCIHPIVAAQLQEAMFQVMKDDGSQFDIRFFCSIEDLRKYDLIIVGNGMGRGAATKKIVEDVLASEVSCILDGDAIYEAGTQDLLSLHRTADVVVTPHLKELSYLLGKPLDELREEPWIAAQSWLKEHPFVTIVAKDDITWILQQDQQALNIIGNHGLAKGGSGDVLCGMIAGLYAQSKDAFASACAAVFAHAFTADQLADTMDPMSMLPSDLIAQLPTTYKQLRKEAQRKV